MSAEAAPAWAIAARAAAAARSLVAISGGACRRWWIPEREAIQSGSQPSLAKSALVTIASGTALPMPASRNRGRSGRAAAK